MEAKAMEPPKVGGDTGSPFHRGEQAVQERLGVRDAIEPWARQVVRPYLPGQHREFYGRLPFVVVAARDADERPWVTILAGRPGFLASPNDKCLVIGAKPVPGDALDQALTAGAEVGVLGIELATRRRNRVNGRITETGAAGLRFEVSQAFGNCPQYITGRVWRSVDVEDGQVARSTARRLDAGMRARIAAADTFFIASGFAGDGGDNRTFGMDASHRGGPPGFVEVAGDTRLVFPDYAGNNHFNTIGNLVEDPRVGLLFVDFEHGTLLQLSGRASIDWNSPAVARRPGAQRLVIVDVERVVQLGNALPLRWNEPRGSVRSLRLARKISESDDVASFEFVSRDGGALARFEAGQYLPLEVSVDADRPPEKRSYSLSGAPGSGRYRISVKREPRGRVSRYLHDAAKQGDILAAGQPEGDFLLRDGDRPVALIGGGIGVTPLVAMLHALVAAGGDRPVHFLQSVRDGAHHPLAGEIRQLARDSGNVTLTVAYSRPRDVDRAGIDFDHRGRIDGKLIERLIPGPDADFYLCGPAGFLAAVSAVLAAFGVDPQRIRTETF